MNSRQEYYHLLDALRGFALLNMLLFHFCYDLFVIFGHHTSWYRQPAVYAWQQFICISFLLISGISWHFSRNNLKRGILLNLYGLVITAVTLIFLPSQAIWFGILNCIGCCTLLLLPIHWFYSRLQLTGRLRSVFAGTSLLLSLLLFLSVRHITDGFITIGAVRLMLPSVLYTIRPLTILGFPYIGFSSSDYFPVFPWFFLFLTGYWLWELLGSITSIRRILCFKIPVLSRIGRKTIWIYLLHQPVLYVLAFLLFQLMK